MFPVLAFVDPKLMTTVQSKFTAYQGFDALFRSTEVYISKFANTLSGYSMVTGACTSEHAMEHAMSAYHHNLPHGAGNGEIILNLF